MEAYVWYLLLAGIIVPAFFYTLYKKRDNLLIALYLFMSGLVYVFEYIILVLFNSYMYHPGVLNNEYFDNIFGSVISNALVIPMSTVMIAAYDMNFIWVLLIGVAIIGIEWLFLNLGIYIHYWWKIPYTFLGFLLAAYIAKRWYKLIENKINTIVRFITLFLANSAIQASFVFILCAILNAYFYKIGWFVDTTRDHIAFATALIFTLSLIFTFIVIFKWQWSWILAVIIMTSFLDWYLLKLNILKISDHWSLWAFAILRLVILALLYLINKNILRGNHIVKKR